MSKRFSLVTHINPWPRLSARRQGYIVVAVPLICLIGSLGAFSWLRSSIDQSQQWVDHTNQVLLESNQLLTGLVNAETGVRGYALTVQPEFLEPYYMAQKALPGHLAQLSQLVVDNPQQEQRLKVINQTMQARLMTLVALIERINQSYPNPLPKDDLTRLVFQGKVEMDKLRLSVAEFEQVEGQLLEARRQELGRQRNIYESTLWVAAIISALGSAFALTLFTRLERNLSERELRLRESKTLIEAIVSNVVDGVVILDRRGNIESINTAAATMFGYSLSQAVGHDLSLLINDPLSAEGPVDSKDWLQHLLGREQPWQTLGRRGVRGTFPMEVSISQLAFDERMIVICRDVTERQQTAASLQARANELAQLNDTLARTNAELQSRNLELDQFAYVASHDLKAPLRAIASLSEWIEEDLVEQIPAENKHQMQLLRSRVHRMEALINGLLSYSRIGRTQIPIESVDVRALIEEIVETLAPPPTFVIEIGIDMPVIKTRRMPLRQVLANLLDNAHKHHPRPDGTVWVSVTDQGRWYEFIIQDNGRGIDPLYHDKIFTIFQTLEARDSRENTGLGLAIIKKILETEGGSIRVESNEGEGATFRFTWLKTPLQPKSVAEAPALEGRRL